MQTFSKPALPSKDLVQLLKSRNLKISDEENAIRYLDNIGYYRLSAYFHPYYKEHEVFKEGATFENVLALYIFDRKLRLLALDPLQRIEVAVRTAISNHMSLQYGPFWFEDVRLFRDINKHSDFITMATSKAGAQNRHLSQACKHYHTNYGDHVLPPSWILSEELSMGCWSKLFANFSCKQDKRAIAGAFHFVWTDFESWLTYLTNVRNLVAHHNRFWNVTLPVLPAKMSHYIIDAGIIDGAYTHFVVIYCLLKTLVHKSDWPLNLASLLDTCPLDVHHHMKFPVGWRNFLFWQ